jgi:ArsR family transcriptional regulator
MEDKLQAVTCAELLKALAEPDRLRIVQCLQSGPKNVSELSQLLGKELANVSHHLKVLRHARLVEVTRQGKFIIYRLRADLVRLQNAGHIADCLDLGCCRLLWDKE